MHFEVLVDKHERVGKCTILPLVGHPSLTIRRPPARGPIAPLSGELLLHHEGQPLDTLDDATRASVRTLSLIDCNWRHLPRLLTRLTGALPNAACIPAGFRTAYPRRNKEGKDPETGLATVEALFVAATLLGTWDESLLAHYYFARDFLDLNASTFDLYPKAADARARGARLSPA